MDFADSRLADDGFEVAGVEPAAGHDGEPVAGMVRPGSRGSRFPRERVGRPPEVNTRSTPRAIKTSRASSGSRVWSNALWNVTLEGPGQCDELGGLVAVDRAVRGSKHPERLRQPRASWRLRCHGA